VLNLQPTPVDIQAPSDSFTIQPPDTISEDCVVRSINIFMRTVAPDLALATAQRRMSMALAYAKDQDTRFAFLIFTGQNQPLSGPQMGENCSSNRQKWVDGNGRSFNGSLPPYDEFYDPYGSIPPVGGSGDFSAFRGAAVKDSSWFLQYDGLDTDMTLACWQLDLRLERRPPPPLQQDARDN
jgi:hypothetical protein